MKPQTTGKLDFQNNGRSWLGVTKVGENPWSWYKISLMHSQIV